MSWQRPKNFRLGKMRHRITIQQATHDDSTGQRETTWSARYSDEPAAYEPATGTETVRGRQVEANTKAVFLIHKRDGISVEDRIVFGSETLGITAVKPVEGGDRYLELHCRGVGA